MTDSQSGTYGALSRFNHWIVAIAMIGMMAVGFYLEYGGLSREARGPIMALHKATGTLLLAVIAWRVVWRLRQGFPAPVGAASAWQVTAAKLVHWGLLAAMLLMPLSGVIGAVTSGRPISIYGLFEIPSFARNEGLHEAAEFVHMVAAFALVGLIGVHLAAAIKHQLIDKDATLMRMLSGRAGA